MNQEKINLNITLDKTTAVVCGKCENEVFIEGMMLRKASRFVTGTAQDALIPIPVFYDVESGEILLETLPKELRKEYGGDNI